MARINTSTAAAGGVAGGAVGGYGQHGGDDAPSLEPPDVFCALGSLVVEGRIPDRGGGRGGGRGYYEGIHVELPGRISKHKCSSDEYLCLKNENFRRHMLLLWQNNVSMSIEVLLCSDCRVGEDKAASLEVGTLPEPGSILLEQWTIAILHNLREPAGMDSLSLLQAVRSYLHFSQLSAWYSKTGGTSPNNVLIRITIPGEEFASKFSRAPEEHYFPVASVGHKSGMAVSVKSLPRSNNIPQVVCSHTLLQAENSGEDREEEAKMGVAGSLSGPLDLRRSLVRAKLAGSGEQLPDCPGGRLFKSDSMDSMLGDSLLDPPQSLSKMAPKRYQSPSRCGSPSLEAPDHLLAGRWEPPPTYEQTLARMEENHPADLRLNRHDIMRRRDMNHFLGLHPRLLTGPPRFSLPPKSSQATRPSPAIPCRAMACKPAMADSTPQDEPVSDRLPEHCQISGKHNCEFEELDDGVCLRPLDLSSESSGSPTGDNYQQAELGAKHKGWTSRPGRTASSPYSGRLGSQRDVNSDDSDNDPRLKANKTVPSLPTDSSDSLKQFRSRVSPVLCQDKKISPSSCKEARRPPYCNNNNNNDCLNDLIASRRSSIDELLEPQGLKVEPQRVTQVWRAELPQTPSPRQFRKIQQEPSWGSPKRSNKSFKEPQERCSSEDEEEEEEEEEESKADILLGAILKHRRPNAFDAPIIHSEKETNACYSPPSPLTPDIYTPAPFGSNLDLHDLCAELETKCLISKQQQAAEMDGKENVENCYSSPARTRSYSEASSPFSFTFGSGIPTLDALDMSFDDFDDNLSFSTESVDSTASRARSEKRRNSVEDEGVPSANKKAAFRKSFDSATSMVFHSRNGLPLTSSPAPMRRGIKFDFDEGITTPKDIKRALFESQQDRSPKKKKRDPRKLLSTSAPASVTGNNLLCNFEESVLNGRLEPVSTVEGFTAEIGASGSFHPKHSTFPVTVFFYTLCENSNIASPYLGHINLGKKGYRVPEAGTIQLTLFNPLGTVVKMFVVMYDLKDMPPNSQTFLRQRTLYMPAEESDNHPDSRKWLRYLIHLRLTSSRSGKIYLHTDVRMIIFRKSDLDTAADHQQGKGYELRSFTRGPTNPKFSPKK